MFVDNSSIVRLDISRARPVACVFGTLRPSPPCWPAPHAQRFQVFRALLLPLPSPPVGQQRGLPPFPDGYQRELGSRSRHSTRRRALGTEVFQRPPRQVRICSTRVQGPGTTIGRFPIIGSSVSAQLQYWEDWHWGRSSEGRTPNRVGGADWGREGKRDDKRVCFSSSDKSQRCNENGQRCSLSTCLSLLSRDRGPPIGFVLLV